MPLTLDAADVDRFRGLVARRLGLGFDDGKLDQLADVLRGRLEASGCADAGSYLVRVESSGAGREEWRALAEQLTVGETFFFRNSDHFRALAELVLPERVLQSEAGGGEVRVLSAGCASGEEAYTLAILARERLPGLGPAPRVRITGIDVNPAMIRRALRARYSSWSLRETPPDVRDRNFRQEGREFALRDEVRALAAFEERNLVEPDPAFWRPDAFDVVFCRNVTMYFPAEAARQVVDRIAGSLASGGYLFLGHAETLRGLSDAFHLRHTHGTFYYQRRREPASRAPSLSAAPAWSEEVPARSAAGLLDSGTSWMDVIRRASERIATLAEGAERAPADRAAAEAPRRTWDLGVVVELLRSERFEEAMKLLGALPGESARDPDAQLLRAVIQTNGGDLEGARRTCRELLEADEMNAGAHYLMALCLEHEGDRRGAREHDQAAAYLDPDFAMPRFHLGLLAKREGDPTAARAELGRALGLLGREDASRILLFGGGFSREALMDLFRGELRACGGEA